MESVADMPSPGVRAAINIIAQSQRKKVIDNPNYRVEISDHVPMLSVRDWKAKVWETASLCLRPTSEKERKVIDGDGEDAG